MKDKIIIASFQSLTAFSAGGIGQLGFMLAQELFRRKKLKTFIVSSKGKFDTPFPSTPVSFWARYYLFLLNKLEAFFKLPVYKSRYVQEYLYDFYCVAHLDRSVSTLVVTTPYLHHTFLKAKRLGIRICFIPGNPEDNYIAKLVKEENKQYHIKEDDAYTYKRRLDYYNDSLPLVDHVITYSSVMEDSYRNSSYHKKIISTRGYLKPVFLSNAAPHKSDGKFKVAFLAYTVLLKGLQYLLEAWKELQHYDMELHIGGTIDKNVRKIIDEQYAYLKNVFYHSYISDVPLFFSDKSVYVLPSIIDGAPVTVLEAMHSSVPVIASKACGTKDIIEEGKSGWIVPPKNVTAIKEKILEAYKDPARTKEMGQYAKTVIDRYNMDDFVCTLADIIQKV